MARGEVAIRVPCAELSVVSQSGQDGSKLFRDDSGVRRKRGPTLASEVMSKSFTITRTWSLHHPYCGSYLLICT